MAMGTEAMLERSDDMDRRVEAFLKDYEAICLRHGLVVRACGCCESPWLDEAASSYPGEALSCCVAHLRGEYRGYHDREGDAAAEAQYRYEKALEEAESPVERVPIGEEG